MQVFYSTSRIWFSISFPINSAVKAAVQASRSVWLNAWSPIARKRCWGSRPNANTRSVRRACGTVTHTTAQVIDIQNYFFFWKKLSHMGMIFYCIPSVISIPEKHRDDNDVRSASGDDTERRSQLPRRVSQLQSRAQEQAMRLRVLQWELLSIMSIDCQRFLSISVKRPGFRRVFCFYFIPLLFFASALSNVCNFFPSHSSSPPDWVKISSWIGNFSANRDCIIRAMCELC